MVIVPVGLDLGPVYAAEGLPGRKPSHYEVHLGADPQLLSPEEYTVWSAAAAADDVDAQMNLKVDRAWLLGHLRDVGQEPIGRLVDATAIVDGLASRGLLLEYDPDADPAQLQQPFLRLRLYPRATGLGANRKRPGWYGLGYERTARAWLPSDVYQVWSFGVTAPSLWEACDWLAAGSGPGADISAAEVAGQVADALPLLVSTSTGFLDLRNYELPRAPAVPYPPQRRSATAEPYVEPVIVPVGLSMGQDFERADPDQNQDHYWQVHLGTEYVGLSEAEFAAWNVAIADPYLHAEHAVTKDYVILSLITDYGIPDATEVVDGLLARGLLLELEPTAGPLEEVFRSVQLFPLGDGLGNSQDRPTTYQVGNNGASWLAVELDVYSIRSYAMTCPSLWHACAAVAASEATGADGSSAVRSTEQVARSVAQALPAMLAAGATFLDPLNYAL